MIVQLIKKNHDSVPMRVVLDIVVDHHEEIQLVLKNSPAVQISDYIKNAVSITYNNEQSRPVLIVAGHECPIIAVTDFYAHDKSLVLATGSLFEVRASRALADDIRRSD